MHNITDCPICKNDFMYHTTDTHLSRAVAWDSDTKEPCSFEIICQDCYLKTNNMEKELKSVITPEGEMKIVDGFTIREQNRRISIAFLEDESILISVTRFEESDEEPYTKEITSQSMRLSKLTFALLMACLIKANVDFGIDVDSIIEELKNKE